MVKKKLILLIIICIFIFNFFSCFDPCHCNERFYYKNHEKECDDYHEKHGREYKDCPNVQPYKVELLNQDSPPPYISPSQNNLHNSFKSNDSIIYYNNSLNTKNKQLLYSPLNWEEFTYQGSKSKGLNISFKYPAHWIPTNASSDVLLQQFYFESLDNMVIFEVKVSKYPGLFSETDIEVFLSTREMINNLRKDELYINSKSDFLINSLRGSYIDASKQTLINNKWALKLRKYFFIYENQYLICVSFVIGYDFFNTTEKSLYEKFNNQKSEIIETINSFSISTKLNSNNTLSKSKITPWTAEHEHYYIRKCMDMSKLDKKTSEYILKTW